MTLLIGLFFIVHATFLYVAYRVIAPRLDDTKRGILLVVCWMSALIPILGEVFGWISYRLAHRFASEKTLIDYDEYIKFDTVNLERLQQQAKADIDTVPLSDALLMDAARRKQSMTQLMSTPLDNMESYLDAGLEHEDTETVHYAATVRNTLFERYELAIKQQEMQLDVDQIDSYYRLIATYELFIDSGLLDETSKLRVMAKLHDHLELLASIDATDLVYLQAAARLAFKRDDAATGLRFAESLTRHHAAHPDGYFMLIEHHMTGGDWTALRPLLDRMNQTVSPQDIPEERRFILERLEGVTQ
ncbi:hypothetical protein L479_00051 [Exiguobacterium sp. S17]|nr:hypothetical protein L479_00051 [Exiguobacterium sp. S17]